MKKKYNKNKILYVKLILDISDEVGISLKESRHLVDFSLSFIKPIKISYNDLKKDILTFITINMFSLICKL